MYEFADEDLIQRCLFVQPDVVSAMQASLAIQERELEAVLDVRLDGWRLMDLKAVRRRMSVLNTPGSQVLTLKFDGKPVLEIHPIEFGETQELEDRWVQKITQRFRRL